MHPKSSPGKEVSTEKRKNPPIGGFNRPFQGLKDLVEDHHLPLSSKPCPPRLHHQPEDHLVFADAVGKVQPLKQQGAFIVPFQSRRYPAVEGNNEDWEVLTHLADLIQGRGDFDLALTDEYQEGHVPLLDPRLMAALKAGTFPVQEYCDLHGMNVMQARSCLEKFLAHSTTRGYRTVLIVHGRGHGSPNHTPVLKKHLQCWLAGKKFRRQVLAFATAQPYDGGAGALYLLLRRFNPLRKLNNCSSRQRVHNL
jgi:DNA-nicking Smr family endonuclease